MAGRLENILARIRWTPTLPAERSAKAVSLHLSEMEGISYAARTGGLTVSCLWESE